MNTLIDSSVFISFFYYEDVFHENSINDLDIATNNDTLWITEHILDEVINFFKKRKKEELVYRFLYFISENILNVFNPKDINEMLSIRNSTLKIINTKQNPELSYTDIYSLVIYRDKIIPNLKVLTYDKALNLLIKSINL